MQTRNDYARIEEIIVELDRLLESLNININELDTYAKTDVKTIWDSKYEKAFSKHINSELIPYLKGIYKNNELLKKHLSTMTKNYKMIDGVEK